VVGRFADRIAHARFALNGKTYALSANDPPHHLHGGFRGFDKAVWQARPIEGRAGGPAIGLQYLSRDGEEGYPGNLTVTVVYALSSGNALSVEYTAVTDRDTVVNLTQHTYFNLSGAGSGDVLDHEIAINADRFAPSTAR